MCLCFLVLSVYRAFENQKFFVFVYKVLFVVFVCLECVAACVRVFVRFASMQRLGSALFVLFSLIVILLGVSVYGLGCTYSFREMADDSTRQSASEAFEKSKEASSKAAGDMREKAADLSAAAKEKGCAAAEATREKAREAKERSSEACSSAADSAHGKGQEASEQGQSMYETISEKAHSMKDSVADAVSNTMTAAKDKAVSAKDTVSEGVTKLRSDAADLISPK